MQNKKYIIRFIIFTVLSLLLLFLWTFPLTGVYFDRLDSIVYYFLNGTLENGKNWQLFWAVTNVRIFDLAGGVLILVFLLFHMYTEENLKNNVKPGEKFIAFIVFTALSIIVNKIILSLSLDYLNYHRESPSLVLDGGIRLSEIITSFEFKDTSKDCFPGDHAAVLLCSAIYFFIYGNKRLGLIASVVLVPFVLPRLVVGAHWFTDCLVGSTFILINSFNIWINIPGIKEKIPWAIAKKYKKFIG